MERNDGQKTSWKPNRFAAGAGIEPARPCGLTDNPNSTARRKGMPDGNRTHVSQNFFGRSIAVELRVNRKAALISAAPRLRPYAGRARRSSRQITMGKWRDRTEATSRESNPERLNLHPRRYALLGCGG